MARVNNSQPTRSDVEATLAEVKKLMRDRAYRDTSGLFYVEGVFDQKRVRYPPSSSSWSSKPHNSLSSSPISKSSQAKRLAGSESATPSFNNAACVGVTESLKILTEKILKVKSIGQGTRRLCRMNKFGFPCSKPCKKYNIPWRTGDITRTESGIIGRVVVQNEKLLEIRVDGNRHRCKPTEIKPVHRKDGYSYA